ncbi:HNH endonuclease [Streptomyces phage Jada]|nr:HNH endonuclease [Streptomyces phage Jada]
MAGVTKYKVGDVFNGKRKIVEYCGSHPKHRVSMWKWECLGCGTIHGPSMTATLTRKDREDSYPSCCHPRNMKGDKNPKWRGYKELTGVWLYQYRSDAKKKGRTWNLTPEYLWSKWELQEGLCAYTGMQLTHGVDASLDRIDSSIGYVEGNVQWVHRDINRMKSDFDESYFIEMCRKVDKQRAKS